MGDQTSLDGATKAVKFDNDKPPMDLLPPHALEAVAGVLGYGAGKYGRHQWRSGFRVGRLLAAVHRHIGAYQKGEDLDPESRCKHLAHAACQLLMALELDATGKLEDDRYKE